MWNFFKRTLLREFYEASYLTLFILLFVCIMLESACIYNSFNWHICNIWLTDFLLNIIAEIIGILLVLFLVNRTLNINQEKERQKFRQIAFRPLKMVLYKQIHLLFNMYKASVESKPEKKTEKIEDLFDDTYFDELEFLDLLKPAPVLTPKGHEMDWLDYLSSEFSNLKAALSKVMDRYSFHLDSEVIDLMEEVAEAGFINFISLIQETKQWNDIGLRGDLLSECKGLLREYTSLLLRLLDLYNQNVTINNKIKIDSSKWRELWGNNVRPYIGDSRIKL